MSPKFEDVKNFYDSGRWSEKKVRDAVVKNWITEEEFELIVGKPYSD